MGDAPRIPFWLRDSQGRLFQNLRNEREKEKRLKAAVVVWCDSVHYP